MAGDHVLPDHAAERRPDDVGRSEAESVDYAYGVIGHVGQRVGSLYGPAVQDGEQGFDRIAGRLVIQPGAEADIPIVEADHVVTTIGQPTTETLGPHGQLGIQPHDQEDRGIGRTAHLLDLDGDPVGLDLRHPRSSPPSQRWLGCHGGRRSLEPGRAGVGSHDRRR